MVTAHGDVAEHGDFFIAAAGFLPCLDQGAVVEINVQLIIRAFENIHLKDQLGGFREQRLFQPLQVVR